MQPLEIVQGYYDQSAEPAREFVERWIDPNLSVIDAPIGLRFEGRESYWESMQAIAGANPDLKPGESVECHEYFGTAERGVVRWTWNAPGPLACAIFGLPPLERGVAVEGLGLVTFRDGRLATLEEFWDGADLRRQLGADIPEPKFPTA